MSNQGIKSRGAEQKSKGFLSIINTYLHKNRVGDILIARGKLTHDQLKYALSVQKDKEETLGQILIKHGLISSRELRFALATQSAFRTMIAVITIFSGITTLSSRQSFAGSLKEIPSTISVAFTSASAGSVSAAAIHKAPLFGTREQASGDLSSFTKWSSMFERFSQQINSRSSDAVVQKWRRDIASLNGLPLEEMADEVNNIMNKVRYIGDNRNWGKSDYWETPVEFLTNGGDCEDFAIAKYVSLRALGVPDKAMRIAIVKDTQKGIPHAILIVYTENGPMVLDNQIKRMTEASDISHYKPIFSINRTAWWLHTNGRNSNPTQIASAAR